MALARSSAANASRVSPRTHAWTPALTRVSASAGLSAACSACSRLVTLSGLRGAGAGGLARGDGGSIVTSSAPSADPAKAGDGAGGATRGAVAGDAAGASAAGAGATAGSLGAFIDCGCGNASGCGCDCGCGGWSSSWPRPPIATARIITTSSTAPTPITTCTRRSRQIGAGGSKSCSTDTMTLVGFVASAAGSTNGRASISVALPPASGSASKIGTGPISVGLLESSHFTVAAGTPSGGVCLRCGTE